MEHVEWVDCPECDGEGETFIHGIREECFICHGETVVERVRS